MSRRIFLVHPDDCGCCLFCEDVVRDSIAVDPVLCGAGVGFCLENREVVVVCCFDALELEITAYKCVHTNMIFWHLSWLESECGAARSISLN